MSEHASTYCIREQIPCRTYSTTQDVRYFNTNFKLVLSLFWSTLHLNTNLWNCVSRDLKKKMQGGRIFRGAFKQEVVTNSAHKFDSSCYTYSLQNNLLSSFPECGGCGVGGRGRGERVLRWHDHHILLKLHACVQIYQTREIESLAQTQQFSQLRRRPFSKEGVRQY